MSSPNTWTGLHLFDRGGQGAVCKKGFCILSFVAVLWLSTCLPKHVHGHIARLLVHLDTHKHESVLSGIAITLPYTQQKAFARGYACNCIRVRQVSSSEANDFYVLHKYQLKGVLYSVTELALVAAGDVGLGQQQLHRSTAQLMEQSHTGKHDAHSCLGCLHVHD